MAIAKRHLPPDAPARDLKIRVFNSISKLSDRDTHAIAVSELESIVVNLSPASVPSFISCIHIPEGSKSPVRTFSVRILSLLSRHHRDALSPFLSRMMASVLIRLRDSDSSVRSACVEAVSDMASHISTAPFSAFLKPLAGALFADQNLNSQIGSALCLSTAIASVPNPEPSQLQKLVPRVVKLLKCDGFRAKPAVLALLGSVIGAGGVSSAAALRNLVPCMMIFVSSEDWAARKAAAEAFVKLAVVETALLPGFKPSCLKTFENRRYDKVKVVRDTMNQMVEAWKEIPDVIDEVSPPPPSQSFSSKNGDSETPHTENKYGSADTLIPASKRSSASITSKKTVLQSPHTNPKDLEIFRNRDLKKHSEWKFGVTPPAIDPSDCEHDIICDDVLEVGELDEKHSSKPEVKRVLFSGCFDEKSHKIGESKAASRVAPFLDDDNSKTTIVDKNIDLHRNETDHENLSLICKHLVRIESQQSNLMDLLQQFIGSSQNGMNGLERRVHGLERAVENISQKLSTARISGACSSSSTKCCILPHSDFWSTKFWRRTEDQQQQQQHTAFGSNRNGLIMNPLAETMQDNSLVD